MILQSFIMNVNRNVTQDNPENKEDKPMISSEKIMSYEEKSVGSTSFFKCEACPYMALAEDDIKFHLFTVHPELAKTNGLADNIQIPCPGCTLVFDAEETLRTHLRNHHKMGVKDVKIMVKSLALIALKNAKLRKEDKPIPPSPVGVKQDIANVNFPQVIEITPDAVSPNNETLGIPNGVTFISVDELQNMSTPNFEKIDPKDIIQEASINIVYTNDLAKQYINVTDAPSSNTHSILQLSNVTPDLISSIQPRPPVMDHSNMNLSLSTENCNSMTPQLPKQDSPFSSSKTRATPYKKCNSKEVASKTGVMCSISGCRVRLKTEDKLLYHRKCHQNGTLQCPECSNEFSSVEQLHTHLWKAHNVDVELHTCDFCSFKSYKLRRLTMHVTRHGDARAYPCSECTKSFKNSHALSKHRRIHRKDNLVKCGTCQREFMTEGKLRAHVAAVHDKVRPYKCSHCEFTSARKEQLKLHLRSHTGDKPYACDTCTYRCSDHNSLRRHKKRHSKESLYKCQYCPYTCIQSTQLSSHIIHKHPDITPKNVFQCLYCQFKSVSKKKYVSHVNTHTDKEDVPLIIELNDNAVQTNKPSWTIPSDSNQDIVNRNTEPNVDKQEASIIEAVTNETVSNIPIEVDDCDSQQESISQNYPKTYCSNTTNNNQIQSGYSEQELVNDLSREDNNSDCLISESSNDTTIERQYAPQISLSNVIYQTNQPTLEKYLSTTTSIGQSLLQCTNVNLLSSSSNFPIRLPPLPHISVRNNITLKPIDKFPMPVTKVTGPIIRPSQILPVPLLSHSPLNSILELEGVPRKKPKISVKSNLILKGPDQVNMFHSQQKMAFKRLEDNERFGLNSPVTFNNLITTQFMQPALRESPNDLMPYSQETMLDSATTPIIENGITDNSQIFKYNPPISVNSINMLPQQQKAQSTDPSYIKVETMIKQNTQSPSLESMCNANAMINVPPIAREYKASPPLEDINKNMSEIKNEVKSDNFYSMTVNNTTANASFMDQYLIDNIIGEQYAGHLDLANVVMPEQLANLGDQQSDVIEIDDNSDDNKLLPRFDMNFPLESLYSMNNDFHFLDNDISGQYSNNLSADVPVNDIGRIVSEVPIINQNMPTLNLGASAESINNEFANLMHGKKDPMLNTPVKVSTNKINVKNIELMKN